MKSEPVTDTKSNVNSLPEINSEELDLSTLVGNEVIIYSEQLGRQPLKSRVVLVNGRTISVDRTGNSGRIDSLVNNQIVTLKFNYKGEKVAVKGTLKKSQGGNCNIQLEECAHPLSQRRFERIEMSVPVKMAGMKIESFDKSKMANLRWMQTDTINLSAGGILLELGGMFRSGSYLILNLTVDEFEFPTLVLGQVRYCLQSSKTRYRTGIEFITREMSGERFESTQIQKFPPVLFEYNEDTQTDFKDKLLTFLNE